MLRSHKKLSYLDNLSRLSDRPMPESRALTAFRLQSLTLIRSVLSFPDIFCVLHASGFARSAFAGYNDL